MRKLSELEKYLEIKENEIIAKKNCEVFLDKSDYKDGEIQEMFDYYVVPGVIDITFPDEGKSVTLPFNFDVHLYKPEEIVDEKDFLLLKYKPGETLIKQKYKDTSVNFNTMLRVLQGNAKFIKDPEKYVYFIMQILDYSIDQVHVEVLVQQMFRDAEDPSKPCRLSQKKKCEIVPVPQIPYKLSWLLGLGFERVDYAIKNALINQIPLKDTAYEKILLDY
jgi:hypothetical protein